MASRAKILVVDDNEANRLLAKSTLEDEDYAVVLATDGAAGVAAFEAEQPDCVLLDIRMPNLDGFGACERIRALPGGVDTPILFLTAARDVDAFDRALAVGGDDFLTKPVRPTELIVRVQTALELRRARSEVRAQVDALKGQRDQLFRVQLQKERLSAFLVHDLKNPVNAMDLHAQLLLRDKTASPSTREAAAEIRTAARNLLSMIMNLLDLSKAEEGMLVPSRGRVELAALVQEVFLELSPAAAARKIQLKSELGALAATADRELLRRVLSNLIDNALRYAPAGSEVLVASSAVAGATELRITDRGKGIPPELREGVFDAFRQMEDAKSRSNRGLGLSFCKSAVRAHGGDIWIEDGSPGTVFCVRLPDDAG